MGKLYGNYKTDNFIGGVAKNVAKNNSTGTQHNDNVRYKGMDISMTKGTAKPMPSVSVSSVKGKK